MKSIKLVMLPSPGPIPSLNVACCEVNTFGESAWDGPAGTSQAIFDYVTSYKKGDHLGPFIRMQLVVCMYIYARVIHCMFVSMH